MKHPDGTLEVGSIDGSVVYLMDDGWDGTCDMIYTEVDYLPAECTATSDVRLQEPLPPELSRFHGVELCHKHRRELELVVKSGLVDQVRLQGRP